MTPIARRVAGVLRYLLEPAPTGIVQAGIIGTMRCIIITAGAFYLQKWLG